MCRMRYLMILISLLVSSTIYSQNLTISNTLDYTVEFPDTNWTLEETSDTGNILYDKADTGSSYLGIRRTVIDTSNYNEPEEWVRTSFIAYKLLTEEYADPWGVVIYWDSSSTLTIDSSWAPAIYSYFYSSDTLVPAWAEYTRFVTDGKYGYEIYAIGDTAEVKAKLSEYFTVINSIDLPDNNPVTYFPVKRDHVESIRDRTGLYNIKGRVISGGSRVNGAKKSAGIYLYRGDKQLRLRENNRVIEYKD